MGLLTQPQPRDFNDLLEPEFRIFGSRTWRIRQMHHCSDPLDPDSKVKSMIGTEHIFEGGLSFCITMGYWTTFTPADLMDCCRKIWNTDLHNNDVELERAFRQVMEHLRKRRYLVKASRKSSLKYQFGKKGIKIFESILAEEEDE